MTLPATAVARAGGRPRGETGAQSLPTLELFVHKKTAFRLSGFLGAVGVTAALVGAAVSGTGAYFTDSEAGNLSATTGHLNLNVTDTNLVLSDLMPGTDKTQNIDYNVDTSGPSDVWLMFDPATAGYQVFGGMNGLGRYGHFKVSNSGGSALFESYNLTTGPTSQSCYVDANGNGGSAVKPTSPEDKPPYCGVPTAIKIASALTSGQGGTINVTFGITGKVTAQNTPYANVPFTVVATQKDVRPDALNF